MVFQQNPTRVHFGSGLSVLLPRIKNRYASLKIISIKTSGILSALTFFTAADCTAIATVCTTIFVLVVGVMDAVLGVILAAGLVVGATDYLVLLLLLFLKLLLLNVGFLVFLFHSLVAASAVTQLK